MDKKGWNNVHMADDVIWHITWTLIQQIVAGQRRGGVMCGSTLQYGSLGDVVTLRDVSVLVGLPVDGVGDALPLVAVAAAPHVVARLRIVARVGDTVLVGRDAVGGLKPAENYYYNVMLSLSLARFHFWVSRVGTILHRKGNKSMVSQPLKQQRSDNSNELPTSTSMWWNTTSGYFLWSCGRYSYWTQVLLNMNKSSSYTNSHNVLYSIPSYLPSNVVIILSQLFIFLPNFPRNIIFSGTSCRCLTPSLTAYRESTRWNTKFNSFQLKPTCGT